MILVQQDPTVDLLDVRYLERSCLHYNRFTQEGSVVVLIKD